MGARGLIETLRRASFAIAKLDALRRPRRTIKPPSNSARPLAAEVASISGAAMNVPVTDSSLTFAAALQSDGPRNYSRACSHGHSALDLRTRRAIIHTAGPSEILIEP